MGARLTALTVLLCLTGCGELIDTMEDLYDVQRALTAQFELEPVHVHLNNMDTLTVTLNDEDTLALGAEQQVGWAIELARYTLDSYGRDKGLKTVVVQLTRDDDVSDDPDIVAAYRFEAAALGQSTTAH